jgi:hypothetical protein
VAWLARSHPTGSTVRTSIAILEYLFAEFLQHDLRVRLWDGTLLGSHNPQFTLVLNHAGALRSMFLTSSYLGLGEAYVFRDFDIEGNLQVVFQVAELLLAQGYRLSEKLHLQTMLGKLPAEHRPRVMGMQTGQKRTCPTLNEAFNCPRCEISHIPEQGTQIARKGRVSWHRKSFRIPTFIA